MSVQDAWTPSVIDFAYEIIALHEENINLKHELDHYKQMHCENLKQSDEHTTNMTGLLLGAVLDPDSALNKGYASIIREQEENK